jgi:uncharacterized protein YdcH (DUF465 family)
MVRLTALRSTHGLRKEGGQRAGHCHSRIPLTTRSPLARPAAARLIHATQPFRGGLEMFENQNPDEVQAMMEQNDEFKRLYQRHKELDKQVLDAELGVRPMDDLTLHTLKKEKLKAKDRLTYLWEHRA